MVKKAAPERLSRDEWIRGAIQVMAEDGYGAVAVEPLAKRLQVTKGSFYWHFRDLAELRRDALKLWEAANTEGPLESFAGIADPKERLRQMFFEAAVSSPAHDLLLAISSAATDPQVKPVLERVTEARIGFIADAFRELGLKPKAARERAILLYTAYVGLLHLARESGTLFTSLTGRVHYVQSVFDTLAGD